MLDISSSEISGKRVVRGRVEADWTVVLTTETVVPTNEGGVIQCLGRIKASSDDNILLTGG